MKRILFASKKLGIFLNFKAINMKMMIGNIPCPGHVKMDKTKNLFLIIK